MLRYLDSQPLLQEFVAYAEEKGVKAVPKEIKQSENFILTRLKAYISRNILGDAGFFPILFKDDEAVKKAIEELARK